MNKTMINQLRKERSEEKEGEEREKERKREREKDTSRGSFFVDQLKDKLRLNNLAPSRVTGTGGCLGEEREKEREGGREGGKGGGRE